MTVMVASITAYFQFLTKNHIFMIETATATTVISLIYAYFYLVESPTYLVNRLRFKEARENLAVIAEFNGVYEDFRGTIFTKEADI